jgi:hypothetical protein
MFVEAAFAACREAAVIPADVSTVFCSRHGEISVIRELLDSLYERQPFSPTLFSNSVHHTPTGYFDMGCGNRHPSKTLSGGEASWLCGYLEGLGALREGKGRSCLLAMADEQVPRPFDRNSMRPAFPYAVAVVLALPSSEGKGPVLTLDRRRGAQAAVPARAVRRDAVLDFLRWFVHDNGPFQTVTPFGMWRWNRTIGRP